MTRRIAACVLVALAGLALAIPPRSAAAQGIGRDAPAPAPAMKPPETQQSVLRVLEAPYLSKVERAAKRVYHGLWTDADVADPALRARAALQLGVFDDPSLSSDQADPLDRAQGAVARGELDQALALLDGREGVRAARLRAQALEGLGRFDDAKDALATVVKAMVAAQPTSAEEATERALALSIRGRLEGRPAGDYQQMIDTLLDAQQRLDRLAWPAVLAQAQLLHEKDNREEAGKAAIEVLTLNPSVAEAWALLGRMAVDSFDMARAESIALKLDQLNGRLPGVVGGQGQPGPAPLGDLLRARVWMRQNDPDAARLHLDRALARLPKLREALALDAAIEGMQYRFDRARQLCEAFDRLSPGSPQALYEVGRALSENRQYDQAAVFLGEAASRQPAWAAPITELGLLEMQSGRDVQALDALRRAVELDPFNVRARNSLALIEELVAYDTVQSEHFVVRFRPGVDGVMAREMLEPLEEIHRIVCGALEHEPSRPTVIELLPDNEWFAVRITGMTGIHTIAASTGPVIAMEAPRIGKKHKVGEYDWVRVLRHEYVHTVSLSRTNNRIPHWFTEAMAVYLEGAPRDYDSLQILVGALLRDELFDMVEINAAFVRPKKQTDRAQAYAQGHWMYRYIVERWGQRAPLELMDLYATGMREAEAMPKVLGIPQAQFIQGFKAWARTDAASWGMLPERSLNDLLLAETMADERGRARAMAALRRFAENAAFALGGIAPISGLGVELLDPTPEVIERLAARAPEHPDVLELQISDALARSGGEPTPSMVPILQAYARARPVDPMPHRHLARLELGGENPERAIPHLEALDALEQYSTAYAVELARRYAAMGSWDSAWAKATRAARIAPFNAAHRELAATIALKRKDLAGAEHHLAALVELEPQHERHRQRLERLREMQASSSGDAAPGL